MKKTNSIAAVLIVFVLLAGCLVSSIQFHGFNHEYYRREYQRLDTAAMLQMSEEDLFKATDALLDYLQNKREDIVETVQVGGVERAVFDERETLHMVDVRNLYQNVLTVMKGLAVMAVSAALWLFWQLKKAKLTIAQTTALFANAFKQVNRSFILVIGCLALYALVDFTAFWTSFHELFFTNDLWLLNPATSIMINMFPESFFAGMVFRIALSFIASYGCINLLFYYLQKKSRS